MRLLDAQYTRMPFYGVRQMTRQLREEGHEVNLKRVRRRTRVVWNFPDGHSAVMLVAARLRHITGTKWGTRRYLTAERLMEPAVTGRGPRHRKAG